LKTGLSIKRAVYTGLMACILAITTIVILLPGHLRQAISVFPIGTTNGVVGLTNGHWAVYCVSNHTTNSYSYAGAKIELKTDNGWVLDPALKPTEVGGWIAPPSRMWHDGSGILAGGGRFRVFFNAPENGAAWRASLRFFHRRPPTVSAALKGDPSTLAAVREAAGNILDRPRSYDVQVPANAQVSPGQKTTGTDQPH
jgi:hypothetical protein